MVVSRRARRKRRARIAFPSAPSNPSREMGWFGSSRPVFAAAEVDLADLLVGLHFVELALAEHGALVEHGDIAVAGDLLDESHVVLDDHNAVLAGKADE